MPASALTVEPKPDDLMKRKPGGARKELLDLEIKLLIGLISTVVGVLSLGVFWMYLSRTSSLELARTMAFTMLAVSTLLYVFSCKSLKESAWKVNWWNNKWLLTAVLIGFGFQAAALYLPFLQKALKTTALGIVDWGVIGAGSLLVILMIEGVKWRFNYPTRRNK